MERDNPKDKDASNEKPSQPGNQPIPHSTHTTENRSISLKVIMIQTFKYTQTRKKKLFASLLFQNSSKKLS